MIIINQYLEAALQLFSKTNYDNVSLNNIIELSKSGKSGFYRLYKGKEEIYFACMNLIGEYKLEYFKFDDTTNNNELDLIQMFYQSRNFSRYVKEKNELLYYFMINSLQESNPIILKKYIDSQKEKTLEYLVTLFNMLLEKDKISKSIDIQTAAQFVYHTLSNPNYPWYKLRDDDQQLFENYLVLIKNAIGYKE